MQKLNELAQLGGPVAIILLLFSVIGLSVALVKFWQLSRLQFGNTGFIEQAIGLWKGKDPAKSINAVENVQHPVAKVLHAAFMRMQAHHENAIEVAREDALRVAREQLEGLRSYMKILEVIASLSPLLGLFGTVLGMIKAFQKLESAGNNVDPSVLSGGIWEALLTTAMGLAVAIPAVLLVSYFDRIIDRIRHAMEDAATRVFVSAVTSPS